MKFNVAALTLDPGLSSESPLPTQKHRARIGASAVAKPTDFAGKGFSSKFRQFLIEEVIEKSLCHISQLVTDESSDFRVDIFDDME